MTGKWDREYATAVFASGIVLFFAIWGIFSPKKAFSEKENRYLAEKPEFSIKTLADGSFEKDYEKYLSDHFPIREELVAVKTASERLMLRQDSNGVYFGKDGYYIEMAEPEAIFTEQLEKNLDYVRQAVGIWEKRLGEGRVHVMLVPSAAQILKGKLPPLASPADQNEVTDRLLKSGVTSQTVLILEDIFLSHEEEPIYYRTDHHWTTLGAYFAYRQYAGSAGLPVREPDEFDRIAVTDEFLGTIEAKVNAPVKPDTIELFLLKEDTSFQVYYDNEDVPVNSLYSPKALEGKDKYAFFLDGNHGLTKILNNKDRGNGRRLMIVKDSYAHCFAPFLAPDFEAVYLVDLRYYNSRLSELMERENITDALVLYQIPGFAKDRNLFKIAR